jgi:hypothetical protein
MDALGIGANVVPETLEHILTFSTLFAAVVQLTDVRAGKETLIVCEHAVHRVVSPAK